MSILDQSFFRRYSPWIIAAFLLLIPVWVWGMIQANAKANNNVRQWLPEDLEETITYNRFREHFGADEFAAVTWPGMTLEDERLDRLVELIVPEQGGDPEVTRLFHRVVTPDQLLDQLTGPPFNLSEEAAKQRLTGLVLAEEGDDTLALVYLSPQGDANRLLAVQTLRRVITEQVGIPPDDLHMAGDPVTNAAIDVESERAIGSLLWWSMGLAFVVAWAAMRNVRLIIAVFMIAGYAFVMSQGLVFFVGGQMNLVLVTMPVLVYVLTLSAGVHMVNYYRDAAGEIGRAGAPAMAIAHGWLPTLLAASTTAAGVGSLAVSHIVPIQEFGYYSALGILASLVLIFLVLPAILTALDRWTRRGQDLHKKVEQPVQHRLLNRLASGLGRTLIRHSTLVNVICFAALIGTALGAPYINTSVKPRRFFDPNHRMVQDYQWLIDRFGPQVPVEVVVRFDKSNFPVPPTEQAELAGGIMAGINQHIEQSKVQTSFNRLRLVEAIEGRLAAMPEIGGTMSAVTFAPPLETPSGFGSSARMYAFNKQLGSPEAREKFQAAHVFSESDEGELWRITARVKSFDDDEDDYDVFLERVDEQVQEYLDTIDPRLTADVTIEYTGMVPLFFAAQNELLDSLRNSFFSAFGLIAIMIIFMLRSVSAGLLSMLPNVFPVAIVFGTMGWTGTIVDIGSMMTASVAMGIAVDDTLHFLTWFRRGLTLGMQRKHAVQFAYDRVCTAMLQTTAIAGIGMAVYGLSSFQPVSQFGLMMFLLLFFALVGDMIWLPALLTSPIGKFFESRSAPLPEGLKEQVERDVVV